MKSPIQICALGLLLACGFLPACSTGGGGGGGGGGAPAGGGDDDAAALEAADVSAEYPSEGDSLVVLDEAETGSTASFKGTVDPDTDEVVLTSLTMTNAEMTLDAALDEERRPTGLSLGSQTVVAEYNADHTVNYELRDGDELLDSGANVVLEQVDLVARSVRGADGRTMASDDEDIHDLDNWGRYVVHGWVADAIAARGYPKPDRDDLYGHPLTALIRSDPLLMEQAYSIGTTYLFLGWIKIAVMADCLEERPGDLDYCTKLHDAMLDSARATLNLAEYVGKTYADSFWDDPATACGPGVSCPFGFVCDADRCVPACSEPTDCPADRQNCTADGLCVAEADDGTSPDGDSGDEAEPDGGDGTGAPPDLAEFVGCWEVELDYLLDSGDAEEFQFRGIVLDIDDQVRLDTLWLKLYVPEEGWEFYVETVLFLADNTGLIGVEPGTATQSIAADADGIDLSFSFEVEDDGVVEVRGLDIRDIFFNPDTDDEWGSTDVNGALFEGDRSTPEFTGAAKGTRITCLAASRDDVLSQAEIEAEEDECGEGVIGMMPVLLLGFGLLRCRRAG